MPQRMSMTNRWEMSLDEMVRFAPSVAQQVAHPDLSEHYNVFPTIELVQHFSQLGWYPVQAVEVRVRDAKNRGFQKHMVRLEHPDCKLSNNEYLQLLITNATNGKLSFQNALGVWSCICSNGLIVGEEFYSAPKIRHIGFTFQSVINASNRMLEYAPMITHEIGELRQTKLIQDEREAFAEAAVEVIMPKSEREGKYINPKDLLIPQRRADYAQQDTLWGTFNIVQENATQGHVKIRYEGSPVERKMRSVQSIDRNIDINRALWKLTEAMRAIKSRPVVQ